MNLDVGAVPHVSQPVIANSATGNFLRQIRNQLKSNRGIRTVEPPQIIFIGSRQILVFRQYVRRLSFLQRLRITGHQQIVGTRQPITNERVNTVNVLLVHVRRNERLGYVLRLLGSSRGNILALLLEVIELYEALIGLAGRSRSRSASRGTS